MNKSEKATKICKNTKIFVHNSLRAQFFCKKRKQMFAFSEHLCYNSLEEACHAPERRQVFGKGLSMNTINKTQKKIYEYLMERSRLGVPPSVREIGAAVGLKSTSSVQANLDALEEAGYIERDPMLKRSIRVLGEAENVTNVPLLGTVTAGAPILAVEQIESYLPYSGRGAKDKVLFALRVRGDSMVNAGILNGDIVIVEKTPSAQNGEIVVAMLEDEATVKRFYKEKGHFRLQPENDAYAPILTKEVVILGRVVALLRNY